MKRSWAKIHLYLSKQQSSSPPCLISPIPNPNSSKTPRQTSAYNPFKKSITTSSSNSLEGLIDPHFNSPHENSDSQTGSVVASNLAEEFAILQGSFSVEKSPSCKSSDVCVICSAIRENGADFGYKTQKVLSKFREKLSESLVVDVLISLQNAELAVKFFIWVGRQIGYNHTLGVYNTLLDVISSSNGDRIPDHFLKEIKDDDDKEVLGKLLNVLIRNYCRNGSWNAALEELGRLKDFGYKPSRVTYNALIEAFLEADKLDTASLVYQEMADFGHKMSAHTLGSFSYSLCKSVLDVFVGLGNLSGLIMLSSFKLYKTSQLFRSLSSSFYQHWRSPNAMFSNLLMEGKGRGWREDKE